MILSHMELAVQSQLLSNTWESSLIHLVGFFAKSKMFALLVQKKKVFNKFAKNLTYEVLLMQIYAVNTNVLCIFLQGFTFLFFLN